MFKVRFQIGLDFFLITLLFVVEVLGMDDTLYLFVNKHIYTQWILTDAEWGCNSPLRSNGVDTIMTLDAAKWNGTGGELSLCVINTSIRSCIIIFETISEQIYQ